MKNRLTCDSVNAILMHLLELYEERVLITKYEGCDIIETFEMYFKYWLVIMIQGLGYHKFGLEKFNLAVVTRIVRVIIDACSKVQDLHDRRNNIIPFKPFMEFLRNHINTATEFIMMLFKSNRPIPGTDKTEGSLAKELLDGMIHKIPEVVSQPGNYRRPLQHVILDGYLSAVRKPTRHNMLNETKCIFHRLLVASIQDIDALDHIGNTLLLVTASQIPQEHNSSDNSSASFSIDIINFLIDQGAYVYARNNEGKSLIDYLANFDECNEQNRNFKVRKTLEMLKNKVPPLRTLAAIKAKDLESVADIPKSMKKFLEMH